MTYGITGNTGKDTLWEPVGQLVEWLQERGIPFCLSSKVHEGLVERGLVDQAVCSTAAESELGISADVILSFGGDGTLLNTVHGMGPWQTPVLGINIGRLGFLADIEINYLQQAIERLEAGDYRVEERMVLRAEIHSDGPGHAAWALNEIVLERSGSAKLISIDVTVDGQPLNTYWCDGLIITTPTGSTAYSLAAGGPIVSPQCNVIVLTPLAPHMLTVRPIVIPGDARIELKFGTRNTPVVLAADGISTQIEHDDISVIVQRERHTVRLVKLPEQHFFDTLRSKLSWGIR